MKVSRKSWHYRAIKFLDLDHPDNLCAYFWMTVFASIIIPSITLCIVAVVGIATVPLWWWFTDNSMDIAIGIGFVEILGLLVLLRFTVKDRRAYEIASGEREAPEQTLFGAWAHAQHRKICPLIDFE